ncbi:MAG: hypothetical protein WA865_00490 [Spirulinaceae cyanobacterium]
MVRGLLETILSPDVWIADRNFCTLNFLSGIVARAGYFIIREHKGLPWYDASEFSRIGSVEGGKVLEQIVKVSDDEGYLSAKILSQNQT